MLKIHVLFVGMILEVKDKDKKKNGNNEYKIKTFYLFIWIF
jgi:hypothetical protein